MQKMIPSNKRINELKKTISILEWDLPNIQNNELRSIKEKELMFCKTELQTLLEKTKSIVELE